MILFFLLLITYLSIGCGLLLMVILLQEELYMYNLFGNGAAFLICFAWPFIISKIYKDNH